MTISATAVGTPEILNRAIKIGINSAANITRNIDNRAIIPLFPNSSPFYNFLGVILTQ
ncbi:hypothetical protein FC35_GL001686 [Limosilactobacillus coleohominis DSM 14060]|nr:hypothetical protein FC35_GL001686 [Limosilactobacillus coleohominis DSM 14060]